MLPRVNAVKTTFVCLALAAGLLLDAPAATDRGTVLIYTRNGKGFVHDNIAASVAALKELAVEGRFAVEVSDDPAVFTDANLKRFRAIIFNNTNNEGFTTDEQREAFQRYIRGGGGFAGIHSATGSERQWPWFQQMIGGKFRRHPPLQPFTIRVLDQQHPSTAFLGETWEWEDECYFVDNINPAIRVLMAADLTTVKDPKRDEYPGRTFGDLFPLAWYQHFEGSRQWYTALGHKAAYYQDPTFRRHLLAGILWAMGEDAAAAAVAAAKGKR